MTTPLTLALDPATRQVETVVALINQALDGRVEVPELTPRAYAALVAECARARSRIQALELKLIAAADRADVASATGLASTGAWVARQTRADQGDAARQASLAHDLDEGLPETSAALSSGLVSAEHARVIAEATRRLPARLTDEEVGEVERALVQKARTLDPRGLRQAARRALEAVEPDPSVVDEHEETLLQDDEARALGRTRLTLHDNGDGTTSGHFTVPSLAGSILSKVLDTMTSPRRGRLGASQAQAGVQNLDRDWAHERGCAFVELLEHLPTDHLHAKTAATVLVRIDLESLRGRLKAAGLDIDEPISAAEARRLACGAGVVPAVLGGASQPLDLGRSKRLFSETQRIALGLRHSTCAADGCDRPFAWCELHHLDPWSCGGPSDLANAVPLCGFHHRRIHDKRYDHRRSSTGALTFHRRT
jgi:hypothetical protein